MATVGSNVFELNRPREVLQELLASEGAEVEHVRQSGRVMRRPHLRADTSAKPQADAVRAAIHRTREHLRGRENFVLLCPAASLAAKEGREGVAVRCGVEKSLITEQGSPSSIVAFCAGAYTACPTWREERRRRVARELVADHEGV